MKRLSPVDFSDSCYALIEFKLGSHEIEDGTAHLCKIEKLVRQHNEQEWRVLYARTMIIGGF